MAISEDTKAPEERGNVRLTVRFIGDPAEPFTLQMDKDARLFEFVNEGLEQGGKQLLEPRPERPLDTLHNVRKDEIGEAISDLEQPLWEYLRQPKTTNDFAIGLVRAFRVNTRWGIAPKAEMSPREILEVVDLDFTAFTLYPPGSSQLYPLDDPIKIERGTVFEAQRDGKYGSS